jgi:hypothetical protein
VAPDGGGSGAESVWMRETDGERRGLERRSAAGSGPWLMGAGGRRAHVMQHMNNAKIGDDGG